MEDTPMNTTTTNQKAPSRIEQLAAAIDRAEDQGRQDPVGTTDDPAGAAAAPLAKKPPSDTSMLGIAGGALVALSAAFLWRDLSLSPAYLVTAGASVGLAASMAMSRRRISGLGLLLLMGATVVGGAWYALMRNALLLPAMAVILLGAVLNLVLAYPRAQKLGDRMRTGQIFALFTGATLVTTSATYFQFLTLGTDNLARRLVLTLLWSLIGVGLVVRGGKVKELAMRYSGYALLAAALGKVLLYDTTHLAGPLRVAVLGLSGAVFLIGSLVLRRQPQPQ
jgi:hypothetical protein